MYGVFDVEPGTTVPRRTRNELALRMQRIREKKHATRVKTENFGIPDEHVRNRQRGVTTNRRDTLVRRIRWLFGFYSLGQTVAKSHAPSAVPADNRDRNYREATGTMPRGP